MWVLSLDFRRYPGGGHGNPLQYSCLESSMDKEACLATVHEVAKSQMHLGTHTQIYTLYYDSPQCIYNYLISVVFFTNLWVP